MNERDYNALNNYKEAVGTLNKKEIKQSENPKAPAGDFYIQIGVNEEKFTVWDKEIFGSFEEGDNLKIVYSESQNEWGGKVYNNKNLQEAVLTNEKQKTLETPKQENEKKPITEKEVEEAPVEEEVKEMARDIIHEETGPDPETYYIVMKGRKYRLVPM